MINKYIIDLKQFNNGESDKITFPTFDQCLMYGIHKLKKAIENQRAIVRAVLIADSHGRNIVITLADADLEKVDPFFGKGVTTAKVKLNLLKDPLDNNNRFFF